VELVQRAQRAQPASTTADARARTMGLVPPVHAGAHLDLTALVARGLVADLAQCARLAPLLGITTAAVLVVIRGLAQSAPATLHLDFIALVAPGLSMALALFAQHALTASTTAGALAQILEIASCAHLPQTAIGRQIRVPELTVDCLSCHAQVATLPLRGSTTQAALEPIAGLAQPAHVITHLDIIVMVA